MQIIRALGSLAFALFLISGLALILTVSTVLESLYGTPFAQENFYQAHWFDFFLGLVWINIFCATLTRWPFKKKHTGFVITHIGILLLLIGSLLTRLLGEEGQMTLFEQEAKGRMLRTGFSLVVALPGGAERVIDLKPKKIRKSFDLPVPEAPFKISVRQIWPAAHEVRTLEEAGAGESENLALLVSLSSDMLGLKESLTLMEKDPSDPRSAVKQMGPATFRLIRRSGPDERRPAILRLTQIHTGKTLELPVTGPIDQTLWKETGLRIRGLSYYRHARVVNNRLVDEDKAPHTNPAVEFEIADENGRVEHHTRFALFPDFNTLRGGRANDQFGLTVQLDAPETGTDTHTAGPAFHFIVDEKGDLSTQSFSSKTGAGQPQPLEVGTPIHAGWMDMKVTVEKVYRRAKTVRSIEEAAPNESDTPAVELAIRREGQPEEIRRLLLGRSIVVGKDETSLRIGSVPKSTALPFSLVLGDFRKIDYPGTSSPASFESDVTLRDPSLGVTIKKTISMNKPLDYAGYRIFQSSYIQDEQLGEASVFTIAKNPGIGLIYAGAGVILVGVILLFYFHPFFNPSLRYNEPTMKPSSQKNKARKTSKRTLSALLLAAALSLAAGGAHGAETDARLEPVLHNGRVKPFDSFARQSLRLIHGKESVKGVKATPFFSDLLRDRSKIADIPWVRIDHRELLEKLKLDPSRHFFSLNEVYPMAGEIDALVASAKKKRDADQRPEKIEQKAEQLRAKLITVMDLAAGDIPEGPGDLPVSPLKLKGEVLYNETKPFEWSAALYFTAFFLFVFLKSRAAQTAALAAVGGAVLLHTLGLAARVWILSRPPVSNMYESMIFMNWALMIFALIFFALRHGREAATAGCAMSGFVTLYANLLPIDSSLDVVVAVLRSNYWLTIHVLTIVASYGAFGLALGLGHRHLFLERIGRLDAAARKRSAALIFRVIQLGVILVGTGTFLGGVWANESWGRFWGWDPKETWALITFLGYLVVVHLVYAKRITDRALAVSSILGFLLVLMTWYGVNFVLGRGLHSYGAGSGGMSWVIYYLVFEATFLGWALSARAKR